MKLSTENRRNIEHALLHLDANKIESANWEGWYCGDKEAFIKRHKKANKFINELLKGNE